MKDAKAMNILVYCNACYRSEENSGTRFYIGECMHLLCKNCLEDIDLCKVCKKTSEFKIVERDLIETLTREPSSFFISTVETSMFQLTSSINLALHYRSQIGTYKTLLKKAREELERCKRVRDTHRFPLEENKKTLFHKPEKKSDAISNNIDRIYRMGKDVKLLSNINREGKATRETTPRSRKASDADFKYQEFNESVQSYSTNASTRLTMSRKDYKPKKPFKHFGNFY